MSLFESVVDLARRGCSVIPVRRSDKVPCIAWKEFQERAASEDELSCWFEQQYPDANLGLVTGAISGRIVLDADGAEGQASLLALLGELPVTPTSKTGKGLHVYLKHPGTPVRNKVRLAPGLDVRGDGGYVVVPPSLHENGERYEWVHDLDTPLAVVPPAVRERLAEADVSSSTNHPEPDIPVELGARNDTLYRMGRALRARGMSPRALKAALVEENLTYAPPLPATEVAKILRNVFGQPDRESWGPAEEPGENDTPHDTTETPSDAPPPSTLFGAEVNSLSSILTREIQPVDWETTGLVPKGQRVMVYGEWGSHKSWLLLSWALHLPRGGQWLTEAFMIPDTRRVLYLDKEMSASSAMRRVQRLCAGMGVTPGEDLPFSLVSGPLFTMDKDGGKRLLDVIDAKGCHAADVLFLETFRRVLKGSENDQEDVSAFWDSVTPLQKAGKTLYVSHHMRKPKGARSRSRDAASGSTDILAGADGVFSLELKDKILHLISVEHHKNRDAQEHPGFELRFRFTGDPDTGPVIASFMAETDPKARASSPPSAQDAVKMAMLAAAEKAWLEGQTITTEYLLDATKASGSSRLREKTLTALASSGRLIRTAKGIYTFHAEPSADG